MEGRTRVLLTTTLATTLAVSTIALGATTPAAGAPGATRSAAGVAAVTRSAKAPKAAPKSAPKSAPQAAPQAATAAAPAAWKPRPEQYPNTVTQTDLVIPMSDGTRLRGDLVLPADASGKAINQKFPVIVTITAYNKTVTASGAGGLGGSSSSYLVKRGYAQLTVDARGTGSSAGTWCAFCTREDQDATEIMNWAHAQPWSNGNTGMSGPSYMGIDQIFAAAGHPAGLKAIFPQVPAGDVYRDVVASGGQLDVGFIPLWLGLVTGTGLIPPAFTATDPSEALTTLIAHAAAGVTFSASLLAEAALGSTASYDGDFYAQRSPINVIDKVNVPTFLISGEFDLFQRGTPTLFDRLNKRGVPTKIIIGPWDHLQGSAGTGLADAGYGSLSELQLRWFDHYVKGIADPTLNSDIAAMTTYQQGTGKWIHDTSWVDPSHRTPVSYKLSGDAMTGGTAGSLTTGTVTPGTGTVLPIAVAGLCTRSTNQWTAGLPDASGLFTPCLSNNATNDKAGVVYESAPVTKPVSFQGPIDAHLFVSSTTGDGLLSVAVEDVAPDGTVTRLTGGWQTISQRALVTSKSRYLDNVLLQPYHPFTQASQQTLAPGQVAPVDVEVFPTGASIQPGHRLRIAVQGYDVPHLLPTLTNLGQAVSVVTVHDSPAYPSTINLPVLR